MRTMGQGRTLMKKFDQKISESGRSVTVSRTSPSHNLRGDVPSRRTTRGPQPVTSAVHTTLSHELNNLPNWELKFLFSKYQESRHKHGVEGE